MAADEAVVAQHSAVVDALVCAVIFKCQRGEHRLGDLIERVDAVSGLRAAGENLAVAHGDIAGILRAGDGADKRKRNTEARTAQDHQEHRARAEQRKRNGKRAERIARIGARATVEDNLTDARGKMGDDALRQEERHGQRERSSGAQRKGDCPRASGRQIAQGKERGQRK